MQPLSLQPSGTVQPQPKANKRMWLTGADRKTRAPAVSGTCNDHGPDGLRVLPDPESPHSAASTNSRVEEHWQKTAARAASSQVARRTDAIVSSAPTAVPSRPAMTAFTEKKEGGDAAVTTPFRRPDISTADPSAAPAFASPSPNGLHSVVKDAVTAATRQLVEAAATGLLQLDTIQSDAVRRSLRMRSERKAVEIAERADIEAEEEREQRRRAQHQRRRQSLGDMTTTFGPAPPAKPDALLVAVEGRHVVGFGAYRGNDVASGHDDAYAARAARVGGDGAVKDARMLPAVRRDIARAIGVAFDFVGDVASVDIYVRRLREAVRLLDEARATLQSITGDALYHLVDDLAALAVHAVQDPSRIAGQPVAGGAQGAGRGRPSAQAFYEGLFGGMVHKLQRAVLGPAGDAVRLLLRVRAFLAQLQALLDQVDYTLPNALGAATVITDDDRPPWGSSSSSVVSGGGPDAMGFARAAARAASARPEDKRAASQLDSLAASDARFVAGEVARCWESRRVGGGSDQDEARALAEANATGPPAVVEVFSPFSPGSPASRALKTPAGFGSPAAARARDKLRAAASPVATNLGRRAAIGDQREPLYDALHLTPQPGFTLSADALDFMRFPRAFCSAIAAEIICVEAVSADDAAALTNAAVASGSSTADSVAHGLFENATDAGPADMLSAVIVRTNVAAIEVNRVSAHLLWLLWRDVLLLYDSLTRRAPYAGPTTDSTRGLGRGAFVTSSGSNGGALPRSPAGGRFDVSSVGTAGAPLASPPAGVPVSQTFPSNAIAVGRGRKVMSNDERADLSRGAGDRRTLDVHAAMVSFRILEATASAHVYPLG